MLNRINKLSPAVLLFLIIAGVSACKKNIRDTTPVQSNFSNLTQVQFINAGVNTTRNSLYVDGVPVNYATVAFGGQFPTGSNIYFAVQPGIRSFQIKDTLNSSTQPIVTFSQNFQFNSFYTVFLYDTSNAVKQKTVLTNIVIPADTSARVRLANFIFSKTAVPAIDVYSVKKSANVFNNIQTTEVTEFIPYPAAVNDTLLVRETGTTNLLFQLNGFNPARKRSYTLVFRGRYQTTTGTIARTLSSFVSY